MYILKLSLVNFKNYDQLEVGFSPKINCFVGDNGVGKTNLLDAIYYLSLTKSYLNSIDTQNISHDSDFAIIQGEYQREDLIEKIHCGISKDKKKQFKRNKKEYSRLADHIGLLPVIMISPADGSLILGGSEERRKFINAVISQYDHEYLENLLRYNKALSQRNFLLRNFARSGHFVREELELWDDQLILYGQEIFEKRKAFIDDFTDIFQEYYKSVSGGAEETGLKYSSQLLDSDFKELLKSSAQKDRMLQYTTAGIHKDDLSMSLGKYPIKRIGSQGQQKTFLVALKLAKFDFIRKINSFEPILLMDDIFDKFDSGRVRQIIRLVTERNFGQIFITDTSQARMEGILKEFRTDYKLFLVENNKLRETNT